MEKVHSDKKIYINPSEVLFISKRLRVTFYFENCSSNYHLFQNNTLLLLYALILSYNFV